VNSFLSSLVTLAQAAGEAAAPAAGAAPARQPSPFGSLWIFIPLIGIMYFLMIRPQQKRQKQQREMLSQLKVGDKVMTTAAALGTLTKVTDKTVRVAFVDGHQVDYVRGAIAEILPEGSDLQQDGDKK
jgi:preprotein translocase subunit YajC